MAARVSAQVPPAGSVGGGGGGTAEDAVAGGAVDAEAGAAADAAIRISGADPSTASTPISATAGAISLQYTGSVSLTTANSVFNAAPFSLNGVPSEKPYKATNHYTATVGGPMIIPKLVNWQKASFNMTFQGSLNRNGSNLLGSVPTDAERAGDFSRRKGQRPGQRFSIR